MPSSPAAIMLVRREDNGDLVVVDAAGVEHQARSGADLWHICHRIVEDPNLPDIEEVSGQEAEMRQVATNIVAANLPEGLGQLAPLAVDAGVEALRRLGSLGKPQRRRKRGR